MLTLTMFAEPPLGVEAAAVRPDVWRHADAAAVARVPLRMGRTSVALGEWFRCEGDPADGQVRLVGDCRRLRRLGAGMAAGTLEILGSVGPHAGAGMSGGALTIRGDAGDGLGLAMAGGTIAVFGKAGNEAGGAEPGAKAGMRGGSILVHGDAGDELGAHQRNGGIAVGGRCGAYAGAGMRAGTIAVFGGHGPHPGIGMVRGSLLLAGAGPAPPATFRAACVYVPPFVAPLLAEFRRCGLAAATAELGRAAWRRWQGDVLELGRGEILRPA